ncbi:MAG: response regulator, partial [Rhodospirillaceae bacterium]|nr:response regulator [Rhodospirillaceae bacterium]
KRLLVVDDQPDMSELVRHVAESLDYEVWMAVDGKEFMRVFDSFDPTVVVIDILMPEIDGIELVKWLKGRDYGAKVFVATAFDPKYAKLAESLGEADGLDISYINKPFQVADLRTALS